MDKKMRCVTKNDISSEYFDLEKRIEIATQILDRNIKFINTCDNKTSIILASIGVLFTIIFTNIKFSTILNCIYQICLKSILLGIAYIIFLAGSVIVLIIGLGYFVSVLHARLKGGNEKSPIFFSGIYKHGTYNKYRQAFVTLNKHEYLDELIDQIFVNAKIAQIKYTKYNKGLKFAVIGFVLFMFSMSIVACNN